MTGFLLVNPRSGDQDPSASELRTAAARLGVEVRVLEPGDDAAQLAREATAPVLGMAGGDGSLASVAAVAIERGLPFVCVPFGTRNHFARDLGLDTDDPLAALASFTSSAERSVDVGRVDGRVFLNNLSIGAYADFVSDAEQPALLRLGRAMRRRRQRLSVNGEPVHARVVLVANNAYQLSPFALGERSRLNEGLLHLYATSGFLSRDWQDTSGTNFRIESAEAPTIQAALDGEAVELRGRLEATIESTALHVLVPTAQGVPPGPPVRPAKLGTPE